ncbi:MAG: LysR family transcriptional regulator [Steroidobacteraceae bacterium]
MGFTLRQLQVFVEAASDQNFRVTADRLQISQPSVSNHIDALERVTGQRLFERGRGSAAKLSSAGREMLARARTLLREAEEVGAGPPAGRRGPGRKERVLRIAAGHYLVDQWIRACLPGYYAQGDVPTLEVKVATSSDEMLSLLRGGKVDAVFYTGRVRPREKGLEVEVLRRVTNSLYGTPDLLARTGTDAQRISDAPMIGLPSGSHYDRNLRARLAVAGITARNVVARSEFANVTLELALAGIGLAMLFDEQVAAHVAAKRLARVPIDFEPGYRFLVTRKGPVDGDAQIPLDYLRKCLKRARPLVRARLATKSATRQRRSR